MLNNLKFKLKNFAMKKKRFMFKEKEKFYFKTSSRIKSSTISDILVDDIHSTSVFRIYSYKFHTRLFVQSIQDKREAKEENSKYNTDYETIGMFLNLFSRKTSLP